ncbi:MAG: hypothetical protein ISS93_02480, partial [Candidatus Aenigmarchaeota archaeon]|nr:hypothetical protein [Candidatus Aenigmarchaeota archaeon]
GNVYGPIRDVDKLSRTLQEGLTRYRNIRQGIYDGSGFLQVIQRFLYKHGILSTENRLGRARKHVENLLGEYDAVLSELDSYLEDASKIYLESEQHQDNLAELRVTVVDGISRAGVEKTKLEDEFKGLNGKNDPDIQKRKSEIRREVARKERFLNNLRSKLMKVEVDIEKQRGVIERQRANFDTNQYWKDLVNERKTQAYEKLYTDVTDFPDISGTIEKIVDIEGRGDKLMGSYVEMANSHKSAENELRKGIHGVTIPSRPHPPAKEEDNQMEGQRKDMAKNQKERSARIDQYLKERDEAPLL